MSSISSAAPNGYPSEGSRFSLAPYLISPIAASIAIVPAFRDMAAKSALQKGIPVPYMTVRASIKEGIKVAPIVGVVVGTQMILQNIVEKVFSGESSTHNLSSTFASSAIVGTASAPVIAVFNGKTMGWTVCESLRRFSVPQGIVIAVQETAFVGGLSVADQLSLVMKKRFGNSKAVDYTAAFVAGAAGSLAGHPANTALTRWQSGLSVDSVGQLMWGSLRKARAVGFFSIVYKLGKETLNAIFETP